MRKEKINTFVLVIDVEACCWMSPIPVGMSKEIIEIGIAQVDYFSKETIGSRSIIIKPQFSEISPFCTKLTTITQELVDKEGISFKKACKILVDEYQSDRRMWFSWGDYDRIILESECYEKKIKYPFGKTHFNLKEWYAFKRGEKTSTSVSNALKQLGLEFDGVMHRGVDDARMTAEILKRLI
jgi:inhibitor of KinA sporulation pathway (predicted exonuclease)